MGMYSNCVRNSPKLGLFQFVLSRTVVRCRIVILDFSYSEYQNNHTCFSHEWTLTHSTITSLVQLAMSKEQEQTTPGPSGTLETGLSVLAPPSRFTKSEKWFIVGFTAFVGLFRWSFIMWTLKFLTDPISPLTSTIYFPAIPTLVVAFHKSTELINLSVRPVLSNHLSN